MLTPQDIENKVFSSAIMGYSREEVNLFLEELVNDYRKLTEENYSLLKKLGILVEKVDEYRKDERYLREAIINAQKISEISGAEAKERAEKLVEDAEKKSDDLIAKANEECESVISKARQNAENIIKEAEEKAAKASAYSEESVTRAKDRFDAFKREVSDFRADLFNKYREHIEFIKDIPLFEEPKKQSDTDNIGNIDNIDTDDVPEPFEDTDVGDTVEKESPEQLMFIDGDTEPRQPLQEEEPIKTDDQSEEKPQSTAPPVQPKSRYENIKFGIDYDISAD